ncbi:MAG: hypothetical protein U0350_04155 [Caldilineaceae bacterium]
MKSTENKKATGAGPAAFQTNKKPQAVRLWLDDGNNVPSSPRTHSAPEGHGHDRCNDRIFGMKKRKTIRHKNSPH